MFLNKCISYSNEKTCFNLINVIMDKTDYASEAKIYNFKMEIITNPLTGL